jgi:methyl-accepting chemotaxis protein
MHFPDHAVQWMNWIGRMRVLASVKSKLAAGFAATAVFACLSVSGWSWWGMQERQAAAVERALEAGRDALQRALTDEERRQLAIARGLAATPAVRAAASAGDRAAMLAVLAPSFEALRQGGDATNLSVILRSGVALARAHQPNNFGDDVSARRQDMISAMADDREQGGIEQLPNGAGVAGIVPVREGGRVVGVLNSAGTFNATQLGRIREASGLEIGIHAVRTDTIATTAGTAGFARSATDAELRAAMEGQAVARAAQIGDRPAMMTLQPLRNSTGRTVVVAEILLDQTAAVAEAAREKAWLAGLSLGVLSVALLLAWLMGRAIAGPIARMTRAMSDLAAGELDAEIPSRADAGEIGAMAGAVQVFKDNALTVRRLEAERQQAEAAADAARQAARRRLAQDFETGIGGVIDQVAAAAARMEGSAKGLSGNAGRSSDMAAAASGATQDASANVQTVAAATEELAASVNEISRQVGDGDGRPRPGALGRRQPDRRRGEADLRHRRPHQPAGAERDHRGGAGRGGGQGVRRGGQRGEEPRGSDRGRHRRDQRQGGGDAGGHGRIGDGDPWHRRHHRGDGGDRDRHRRRGGGTGQRDPRHRPEHPACRTGHHGCRRPYRAGGAGGAGGWCLRAWPAGGGGRPVPAGDPDAAGGGPLPEDRKRGVIRRRRRGVGRAMCNVPGCNAA